MTIYTAKNKNRIDVWPRESIARVADTEESKLLNRMTVWKTKAEAQANVEYNDSSSNVGQGVHFDGNTWLLNAALDSSDNGTASFSGWFNMTNVPGFPPIWGVDPAGISGSSFGFGNDQTEVETIFSKGSGTGQIVSQVIEITNGSWFHFICSVDVRRGTPILTQYLTDVSVGNPPLSVSGWDGSSTIPFNGLPFYVANDTFSDFFIGDMADLWIAPGVSLLDVGGDIPLTTRRKFIDGSGKPVFLGANGEVPTGTAPAIFLSANPGNAASFATNRGTGGSFALTGTLTTATGP